MIKNKVSALASATAVAIACLSGLWSAEPASAQAAETKFTEKSFRIPFTAELYTDTNRYYEVPMYYLFAIDDHGTVYMSAFFENRFYADQEASKWTFKAPAISFDTAGMTVNMHGEGYLSQGQGRYDDCCNVNIAWSDSLQIRSVGCGYTISPDSGTWTCTPEFSISMGDYASYSRLSVASGSCCLERGVILKLADPVYTDADGYFFIVNNDGTKNYFTDMLTLTCNDTEMSRTIGSGSKEHPATLDDVPDGPSETPETADEKITRLETELEETQKSLREAQDEINSLNKYHEDAYGDINRDGRVNASDAALTLQYAAYVGAGGNISFYKWMDTALSGYIAAP